MAWQTRSSTVFDDGAIIPMREVAGRTPGSASCCLVTAEASSTPPGFRLLLVVSAISINVIHNAKSK
jgi:hypothetical protein